MLVCWAGEGVARRLPEEAVRLGEDVAFVRDCDEGLGMDAEG